MWLKLDSLCDGLEARKNIFYFIIYFLHYFNLNPHREVVQTNRVVVYRVHA